MTDNNAQNKLKKKNDLLPKVTGDVVAMTTDMELLEGVKNILDSA